VGPSARNLESVDPRFVNEMLEQATHLQDKFGYREEESEAFVNRLPDELRLRWMMTDLGVPVSHQGRGFE